MVGDVDWITEEQRVALSLAFAVCHTPPPQQRYLIPGAAAAVTVCIFDILWGC